MNSPDELWTFFLISINIETMMNARFLATISHLTYAHTHTHKYEYDELVVLYTYIYEDMYIHMFYDIKTLLISMLYLR